MIKTLITFAFFASILFSCSSDEEFKSSNAIENNSETSRPGVPPLALDPTKLKKVIFRPGSAYQKTWTFYDNGLLRKSVNSQETQTFIYDNNKNLISTTKVTPNFTSTATFTYDISNHLTAVNGYPVVYDASLNKYIFNYVVAQGEEYDNPHRSEIELNINGLLTSRKVFFTHPDTGEFYYRPIAANYVNGNVVLTTQQDGDTAQNYQFDANVNPLKAALLPICKVMPLVNGPATWSSYDEWVDARYSSTNNTSHISYFFKDPESASMAYQYNLNDLPFTQTYQAYYFGEIDGFAYENIHYYYQGDITPH